MDKLIHTALNSLGNMRDARVAQANNLANSNVPGFRRDLSNNGSARFLDMMGTLPTRAFQVEIYPEEFSSDPGFLNKTGENLDIAIVDKGFFFIRPENGQDALSRRGDLHRDPEGYLRDGSGATMLDVNRQPIQVPDFLTLDVNALGEVRVETPDVPGVFQQIATLATIVPDKDIRLKKFEDGHIRLLDGQVPEPNQGADIAQGMLEGSNVNTVEELVASIETQRQFEFGLRMVRVAKENDEAASRLLRIPE